MKMEKTELVTIAIPVYERDDYFQEALDSALNQTIKCHIVVSDNGSSHNRFEEICKRYAERVEYHKNLNNLGMFPNWNKLIGYTKTPFVTILGDDDILDTSYIENFINIYHRNPNIDVYYSNFEYLLEPQKEIQKFVSHNLSGWGTMEDVKRLALKYKLEFPSVSSVVRTSVYKEHPFEALVHGSNDWLSVYNFDNTNLVYGNKKTLYLYRVHDKAYTKRNDMINTFRLSHLLILSNIAFQIRNTFIYKIKWLGQLKVFLYYHHDFCCHYFATLSMYTKIFNNIKNNHRFLYLVSTPLGFIFLFFLKFQGKCQRKK